MKYLTLALFLQYCIIYTKAIIGNNIRRAEEGEFPFIVSISVRNPTRNPQLDHLCTAAMITKKHALTAEHCMRCTLVLCRVIAESIDLRQGKRYKVESWITYTQWAETRNIVPEFVQNDVAVVTLEKCVENPNVIPALITNLKYNELYGLDAVIASWGATNNGTINIILETVQLKTLTRKKCRKRINKCANERTAPVPESIICTIAEPYALLGCGDSGGPLLDMNNNIIGISIATCPDTNIQNNPLEVNIHISIPYYKEFILDSIY